MPKSLITLGSMALFIWVLFFVTGDLWFSVGFTLMLFIHEFGHLIAFWSKGYKVSAPVFIPMLGAVISGPKIENPDEEAYIGYGGPFWGSLAAIACFIVWKLLPDANPTLLKVSFFGIFLNLFNLLPVRPLDGGRITQAISGLFKYLGLIAVLLMVFFLKNFFFVLILMMVLMAEEFLPISFKVHLPMRKRIKWFVLYFGLAGILIYIIILQWPLVAPLIQK